MPFNMLTRFRGYSSLFTEKAETNEYEQNISQSIHTVFHSKYGITNVNTLDLIFLKYFLLSYPLKNVIPDNIKNIGTANCVIERQKKNAVF